jgi:hypothetical protein
MKELEQLQELMLKKNLVIRALPKEIEYRYIYTGVSIIYKKKKYDNILRTNPTARLETSRSENQYIVYKELTDYQKDRFIVSVANHQQSSIEWLRNDKEELIKEIDDKIENLENEISSLKKKKEKVAKRTRK